MATDRNDWIEVDGVRLPPESERCVDLRHAKAGQWVFLRGRRTFIRPVVKVRTTRAGDDLKLLVDTTWFSSRFRQKGGVSICQMGKAETDHFVKAILLQRIEFETKALVYAASLSMKAADLAKAAASIREAALALGSPVAPDEQGRDARAKDETTPATTTTTNDVFDDDDDLVHDVRHVISPKDERRPDNIVVFTKGAEEAIRICASRLQAVIHMAFDEDRTIERRMGSLEEAVETTTSLLSSLLDPHEKGTLTVYVVFGYDAEPAIGYLSQHAASQKALSLLMRQWNDLAERNREEFGTPTPKRWQDLREVMEDVLEDKFRGEHLDMIRAEVDLNIDQTR
jgi:hypothetical protein